VYRVFRGVYRVFKGVHRVFKVVFVLPLFLFLSFIAGTNQKCTLVWN